VWQWNAFTALTEHTVMELQLQAGSAVVASTNFATSVFNTEWTPVNLKGPGAGLVQCQVKLRGGEYFTSPSAPPAADQEATNSENKQPVDLQLSLTTVSSKKTALLLLLLQKTASLLRDLSSGPSRVILQLFSSPSSCFTTSCSSLAGVPYYKST
jgi:hypothetical protein